MESTVRILLIEDSEDDALLIEHHIKKGGFPLAVTRIQTASEMRTSLKEKTWDIILSDYKLPQFNGMEALLILKESGQDLPFIVISGTIGEDVAVDAMKAGAHDYIMKNNLMRLLPAIDRELREAKIRAEQKLLEQKQRQTEIERLNYLHLLENSEKRYKQLLDSVTDYIYTVQIKDGRPVSTVHGPNCVAVTGYPPEAFAADPNLWYSMVYEPDRAAVIKQTEKIIAGEQVLPIEHRIIHKSSAVRWVRNTCVPRYDEQHRIMTYDGLITDITERKNAEMQVYRLNRMHTVLSNVDKAIVRMHDKKLLLDEVCRIAVEYGKFHMAWIGVVNRQTSKVDVTASYGVCGDYLDNIDIDLNDKQRGGGPAGMAVKTGKPCISNNILRDDRMIPWRANAMKYGYKSGASFPLSVFHETIGIVNVYSSEVDFFDNDDMALLDEIAHDISFALEFIETEAKRKLSEEALREKDVQLMQEDKMASLGRIVSGVAHEINNPNNFIMLNAPLLRKAWETVLPMLAQYKELSGQAYIGNMRLEEFSGYMLPLMDGILDGSRRIARIVTDLKEYAKPDTGDINREIDFVQVIGSALNLMNNTLRKKNVDLRVSVGDGPVMMQGSSQKLGQVIINLLQNSCDALEAQGSRVISLTLDCSLDDSIVLRVLDTGCGIAPQDLPHIFEPFFTTKRGCGGTGLGLSISSKIIIEHGGKLLFESEVGKGTTAFLKLPRQQR